MIYPNIASMLGGVTVDVNGKCWMNEEESFNLYVSERGVGDTLYALFLLYSIRVVGSSMPENQCSYCAMYSTSSARLGHKGSLFPAKQI